MPEAVFAAEVLVAVAVLIVLHKQAWQERSVHPLAAAVAAALPPTTALHLEQAEQAEPVPSTSSPIANMITDSKNINWTPSEDRSVWTSSEGGTLLVSPDANDEQVLSSIEQSYLPQPVEKTDAERIAELEAKLAAFISKLS